MRTPEKLAVAFDTWYLSPVFRNRGIYVYSREILDRFRALAEQSGVEIRPFTCSVAGTDGSMFGPAKGLRPAESVFLNWDRTWRYGGGWLATTLLNPDVLFCPSFTTLQLGWPVPTVTTIHDVTPFVMPNFTSGHILRKLRFQLAWAVRRSRRLIAISKSCKRDLIQVFRIPESTISVVYSGFDKARFNASAPDPRYASELRQTHGLRRPYLFHHGLMQPRKNLKRLIQAYGVLLSRNADMEIDLVLAGQLEWRGQELVEEARKIPQSRGKVVFTGAIADEELATLLKGARMAVIPSLYEGFCLPLVEAMGCGVPTVCSNTSCLPEISGGVLKYFDPESVEDMAGRIEEVLRDEHLRKQLAEQGLGRAAAFDWNRSAEETLDVLVSAAQERRR